MTDASPEPTEEEILASVFYHCDEQQTGFVAVSQILEFLRRTKADWDFGELKSLLDPDDENPVVDLDTYQRGISRWVQSVRSFIDEGDTPDGGSSLGDAISSHQSAAVLGSPNIALSAGSGVIEGNSCDTSRSWEYADAVAALEQSKLQVKHLSGENELLQQAVATAEEQNTHLIHEVEVLRKRVAKQDALLSRRQERDDEFEVAHVDDHRQYLQNSNRISQLEKEKAQVELSLTQSEDERVQLAVRLEQMQEEYHSAVEAISTPSSLQQQLVASMEKSSHLESFVSELSSANQILMSDKRHLESLLVDIRDQQAQSGPSSQYGSPLKHSTPRRFDTLHDELLASDKSPGSQSPRQQFVVDVSLTDRAADMPHVNGSIDWRPDGFAISSDADQVATLNSTATVRPSSTSSVASSGSTEDLMSVLTNVRHNFQAKKALALKQLADMSDAESQGEDIIVESSVDVSMNSFASFESKLARLVAARKSAVERLAKAEKANAHLNAELDDLRMLNQHMENRLCQAEGKLEESLLSLSNVAKERDMIAAEAQLVQDRLVVAEEELREINVELEDLRNASTHTCKECGKLIPSDTDTSLSTGTGTSTSTSPIQEPIRPKSPQRIVIPEAPAITSPILQDTEKPAIAALLKGLPSEFNLLRSEPSSVEQQYFSIAEILQDLCESAEGCPETMRRAKEEAESRSDWCVRHFVALSAVADEPGVVVDKCASDQLVTQLKHAVQMARIAGRSEQDFVYLTLIKVLVQYISLVRLEVFLPSMHRSPPTVVCDSQGSYVLSAGHQSVPRTNIAHWSKVPGLGVSLEEATAADEATWDQACPDSASRQGHVARRQNSRQSGTSTSKSVSTVFHEASISHRQFGDVFPPDVGSDTATIKSPLQECADKTTKVLQLVDERKELLERTQAEKFKATFVWRGIANFLLLLVVLFIAVFFFLSPSDAPRNDHRSMVSLWSLLPLDDLGAQYTLRADPIS